MINNKLFERIFRMKQDDLLEYLPKYLVSNGYRERDIENDGDYIYVKGNIPIMLVAHLDTVHKTMPGEIYHDTKHGIMWSPQGLGADDRAGVYSILQLLEYKPYILFTTDEEIGGVGARIASKSLKKPPVNYIIELDRQGKDDCVFYSCDNPEFTKYVETFGFQESFGTFSDISYLAPAWGIAAVNLSIGYSRQHTISETLNVRHMVSTIDKVRNMLKDKPKFYEYIEEESKWGYWDSAAGRWISYSTKGSGKNYKTYLEDYGWETFECSICGIETLMEEESRTQKGVCVYCEVDYHTCVYCGITTPVEQMRDETCCEECFRYFTEHTEKEVNKNV